MTPKSPSDSDGPKDSAATKDVPADQVGASVQDYIDSGIVDLSVKRQTNGMLTISPEA
jgi:hypothetical protein